MIFATTGYMKRMNHFTRYSSSAHQRGVILIQWLLLLLLFSILTRNDEAQRYIYVDAFHQHVSPLCSIIRKTNYDRYCVHFFTSDQLNIAGSSRGAGSSMNMAVNDDTSATSHDGHEVQSSLENHFFDNAIINHKLQGLHLSDQKLLVLQDAAKRMVQRHEEQIKEVQRRSIEERNIQHQTEIEKIHHTMDRRLKQMEFERSNLVDELKRRKQEYMKLLEAERDTNRMKMIALDTKYEEDCRNWIETERRLRDEIASLQHNVTFTARNASRAIRQLNLDMEQQQQNRNHSLKAELIALQERYHRVETEMKQLRNENVMFDTERASLQDKVVREQGRFEEQLEIAKSAVAVATKREADCQVKNDELQQTNRQLHEEVSRLNQELQYQKEAYLELEEDIEEDRKRRTSPILYHTLQRVHKFLWRSDQSLLRSSGRWIQSVFVPKILPFVPTRRKIGKKTRPQK